MTATIYVLTEGDYSDYRIVALYSTLELAEAAKKLCPNSRVEEYELDALQIPEHPPGRTAWFVRIDVKKCEIGYSYQVDALVGFLPEEIYNGISPINENESYIVKCWARDEEHARKIALDKFYQFKAEKILGLCE